MSHLKTEEVQWGVFPTFDWKNICKIYNMLLYKKTCDEFKMCKISGALH